MTPADAAYLDFEKANPPGPSKAASVRIKFHISMERYHARLGRIIEDPAALRYNPDLVLRLISLRDNRRARRHLASVPDTHHDPRQKRLT